MNRGAWQATVRGVARVGQDLATKEREREGHKIKKKTYTFIQVLDVADLKWVTPPFPHSPLQTVKMIQFLGTHRFDDTLERNKAATLYANHHIENEWASSSVFLALTSPIPIPLPPSHSCTCFGFFLISPTLVLPSTFNLEWKWKSCSIVSNSLQPHGL